MDAENQQKRVSEVLDLCEAHWIATEVPFEEIDRMRDELQQHLDEAAGDHKPVESVVGPDTLSFAEEWASHARPTKSLAWKVMGWIHVISGYLLLLLGVGHLLNWSLIFPSPPITYLYGFVAIALSCVWFNSMPLAGALRFDGPPVQQIVACVSAALLTMTVVVAINLIVSIRSPSPLYNWSWIGTLIVFLVSLLPGKPKQQEPEALQLSSDQSSG